MPDRTTLHWKYEDGRPDAEDDDPNDVGPAWIIEPDGSERDVQDGEWITRADATRLAEEQGFDLDLDDGASSGDAPVKDVDVDEGSAIKRVRMLG